MNVMRRWYDEKADCEVIAADVHDDLRERDGWSIQQLTTEVERLRRLHAGAVGERDSWKAEAHRLRTLMAEASKQDPAACQRWIKDGLTSAQWGQ
jgi:hypothetical protein